MPPMEAGYAAALREPPAKMSMHTCGRARRLRRALSLCCVVGSAGCAVGPDFHQPDAPTTDVYTAVPLAQQTSAASVAGGAAQRFVSAREIPAQWWTLFRSSALDQLMREALAQS